MKNREDIFVANPTWDGKFKEAQKQSFGELDNFYIGYGFSDQCFLARTSDFKKQIYNDTHDFSKCYPRGNPFEAMVNSYMQNHKLKRLTHKIDSYTHINFKRNKLFSSIALIRNYYAQSRLNKHLKKIKL